MTGNPDMQASIPMIMQLLDQVHSGQTNLLQLWQLKKVKLDQCLQLRLFEQDCEKVRMAKGENGEATAFAVSRYILFLEMTREI